jgi:hypothetical protein
VAWQRQESLASQRHGPQGGKLRQSKGGQHTGFRTVFGARPVASPRCSPCPCQAHATASCSPLAALLPERTTPELLYLATKWASLASYGPSVKRLQDVWPFDAPLEAMTIRHHVCPLAQRWEKELGEEQGASMPGGPRDWGEGPTPDGPLTVGLAGGYVKAPGAAHGWFAGIAGKSLLAFRRGEEPPNPSSKCFAFVPTADQQPTRRLCELWQSQGLQRNQQIALLSDGGDTGREVQRSLSPEAEHLLDWLHRTRRLTTMPPRAQGFPDTLGDEQPVPLRDALVRQ